MNTYIICKHYDLFLKNKKAFASILKGLAVRCFLQDDTVNSLRSIGKSIKLNPFSLKSFIFFIFLILPLGRNFKTKLYKELTLNKTD